MGRIFAAAAALGVMVAACSSSTGNADVDKFNSDVHDQGIASSLVQVGDDNLGVDVCADIKNGQAAANVVINVQAQSTTGLTMRSAEIIVYYAITDICSDQMSQRQNHWKDGS